jgi:hypothetical protein
MQRKTLQSSPQPASRSASADSLRTKTYREKSKSHTDLTTLSTNDKYVKTKTSVGPITSLVAVGLTMLACFAFASWRFHWLPYPVVSTDPLGTEFSETLARNHVKVIEGYGHRLVGLEQHANTADYIFETLSALPQSTLSLEVEYQSVNASHRFDIAGKTCHKLYHDVVNVVARISCATCDNNPAIVINTHYDTNPATLGAADAAVGVGIMLEVARIFLARPPKDFKNPVILLFNGAEETLQDGSHGWITQHKWSAKTRALINLEGCGHNGREALFQANSPGLIRAYQKGAKYPHGSVFGNDIFGTGLMISDTDYRQFMEYTSDIVGLDLAYYTQSYIYHTMRDTEDVLQPGSVQHFGENVLGVTKQLVKMDLKGFKREFSQVYYDFFGWFVVAYSWTIGLPLHLLLSAFVFSVYIGNFRKELPEGKIPVFKSHLIAIVSVCLSLVASILAPILLTVLLRVFKFGNMGWFNREHHPFLQYAFASVCGMLTVQYMGRRALDASVESVHGHFLHNHAMEKRTLYAALLFMNLLFLLLSVFKIGSSFLIMYHVIGMLMLIGNARPAHYSLEGLHPLRRYVVGMVVALPIQFGYSFSLAKLFVPLMGRAGSHTPSDVIIAVVVGLLTYMILYPLLAFSHRFGEGKLKSAIALSGVLALILGVWFSLKFPFDEAYAPKRVYVQYRFNQTAGTSHVDIAHGDASRSTFKQIIEAIDPKVDFEEHMLQDRSGRDMEWVVMYPLNFFIDSINLPGAPFVQQIVGDYDRYGDGPDVEIFPKVTSFSNGTRQVAILFKHVNLILPTVTISGHLISWNVNSSIPQDHFDPFNPLKRIRADSHTLRISSGQGVSEFELSIVTDDKLRIDYVAMDPRSWGIRNGDLGIYGDEVDLGRRKLEDDLAVQEKWEGGEVLRMVKARMPKWTAAMYFASIGGTWYI